MFDNINTIVSNYITVSRNISIHNKRSIIIELTRIIASRVFYGMGPDAYDRRRFSKKKLRQILDYMSLHEREDLQKSLCPEFAREQVDNKLMFYEKALANGLPTPVVYGAFLTKEGYVPKGIPALRTLKELRDFLDQLPEGNYVVKPISAGHGWGVSVYHIKNGTLRRFQGDRIEIDQFVRQIKENSFHSFGYMFQEYIRPHQGLKSIMPGPGIGTFRIVTFLEGERSVIIPFAVVKIPVGGSITDNFDGGHSGNWICPVDVDTGRLGHAVGKTAHVPVFSEIEKRTDTGAVFRETVVPLWKEVRSILVKSALVFSDLRTMGWDIAVTDAGVTILEANWAYGENLIEVAYNRGLRHELTELTRKSLNK